MKTFGLVDYVDQWSTLYQYDSEQIMGVLLARLAKSITQFVTGS